MTKTSIRHWLSEARQRLHGREDGSLEAQLLLADGLGISRVSVLTHPEYELDPAQEILLDQKITRLLDGEPLPYILGSWEFYGLQIEVSPAVLIPRPETEILVEVALEWLRQHPAKKQVADVGTGSGCISTAIARHHDGVHILAGDLSHEALRVAKRNFDRHNLSQRVFPVQSDLLSCYGGFFDLVCANLPYIPTGKLSSLQVAAHEPRTALDGGSDGLQFIRKLLLDSNRWLASGGIILLEIEAEMGICAPELARKIIPESEIRVINDLAGLPRVVSIQI